MYSAAWKKKTIVHGNLSKDFGLRRAHLVNKSAAETLNARRIGFRLAKSPYIPSLIIFLYYVCRQLNC